MNTNPEEQQAEGAWDKLKGKVKEVVGDATDNESLQAEGKMDHAKGSVKGTVGEVRENLRDKI